VANVAARTFTPRLFVVTDSLDTDEGFASDVNTTTY
jgi:hypothetical protein